MISNRQFQQIDKNEQSDQYDLQNKIIKFERLINHQNIQKHRNLNSHYFYIKFMHFMYSMDLNMIAVVIYIIVIIKISLNNSNITMIKDNSIDKPVHQNQQSHSHGNDGQHQQDDCEDCQKQRAQNNQLIQFYERLHKIKDKVSQIKPTIQSHHQKYTNHHTQIQSIQKKITDKPDLQKQLNKNGGSMKNMGYQLAIALLERQIRMKKQNQKISKRIRDLERQGERLKRLQKQRNKQIQQKLKDSLDMSQNQTYFYGKTNFSKKQSSPVKGFNDSLDNALQESKGFWSTGTQRKTSQTSPLKKVNKSPQKYIQKDPFYNVDNSSTFSSFQDTKKTNFKQENNQKYQNLNLWLYQFDDPQKLTQVSKLNTKKSNK